MLALQHPMVGSRPYRYHKGVSVINDTSDTINSWVPLVILPHHRSALHQKYVREAYFPDMDLSFGIHGDAGLHSKCYICRISAVNLNKRAYRQVSRTALAQTDA